MKTNLPALITDCRKEKKSDALHQQVCDVLCLHSVPDRLRRYVEQNVDDVVHVQGIRTVGARDTPLFRQEPQRPHKDVDKSRAIVCAHRDARPTFSSKSLDAREPSARDGVIHFQRY